MIKLLLIDDEIWTRNSIKAFGNWDKYNITIVGEASDGIEGVRLIKDKSPQIIITDMNMPGMDGVNLLKILKEEYPFIKVIVVSGYSDFNYTKQAIKSNAIDYILKPVDPEELNMAIEKCVNEIRKINLKKDLSVYDLAKSIDKKIIAQIIDEKKVIEGLLAERNISGIKSILNRLYNNIVKSEIQNVNVGKFLYKIFSEMIGEYLLTIKEDSNNTVDITLGNLDEVVKAGSLHEYFKIMEETLDKTAKLIDEWNSNKDGNSLLQIKKYIETHYTEHISLEGLANMFFISKEYLCKAFKTKFKINLMSYITELRMEKAKQMIEDTSISIKTISQAVGYEDVSHFYRVFKSYFSISPGEMRKEIKNK